MIIPNIRDGITAELDAHIDSRKLNKIGGYFTTMTIGGSTITPCLESKLKGDKTPKYAAFFERLWIENNAVLIVDLLVDAPKDVESAASKLNKLYENTENFTFTGKVGAYANLSKNKGVEVLKEVDIKGQIKSSNGDLQFERMDVRTFGKSHNLEMWRIHIWPDEKTNLQITYAGSDKGVWIMGPTTHS